MAFDINTAKPEENKGFDLTSAKSVENTSFDLNTATDEQDPKEPFVAKNGVRIKDDIENFKPFQLQGEAKKYAEIPLKYKLLPKWDEKAQRFEPANFLNPYHPEANIYNAALNLKDIAFGGAMLAGKGFKGLFVDLPREEINRFKNHQPLISGQDFINAGNAIKNTLPVVGNAIIEPYKEALHGNLKPIQQNPLTTALDVLSVGELGSMAKLGASSTLKDLGKLAVNPRKFAAEALKETPAVAPEGIKLDIKPTLNELTTERPLNLKEFKKAYKEIAGKKVATIKQYQNYMKEYNTEGLYTEGKPNVSKQLTQQYFQKYGQKLKNPNYPAGDIGKLEPTSQSSEQIFNELQPNRPIQLKQNMPKTVGQIYNKFHKNKDARLKEIGQQIESITGNLNDTEKTQLVDYLQDPLSFKAENPNIINAHKQITDIINQNTDFLTKGGYLAEETAKTNPYQQAVVSRWIKENLKDLSPAEIKRMADEGSLETYAKVTPEQIDSLKAEYANSDVKPSYLPVTYEKDIKQALGEYFGRNKNHLDTEQAVSILNKRQHGISPKIDINKSLNKFMGDVERLQANKNVVDNITQEFAVPLEEFGKVKKGHTVWSPDLIIQAIKDKGYGKSDDIIREFLKKSPDDIYRQATKEGVPVYQVPEKHIKDLSAYYYKPAGVDKVLQDLNRPFKRYALATGRFITNNAFNNTLNNMVEGVPLSAYKMANNPELKPLFPAELNDAGFFGSEKYNNIPLVEKGINAVTNKLLPFKPTQNLLSKGIDTIFNINSSIENSLFRANYIKQMDDIARKNGIKLEDALTNPNVQELALDKTYKTLGNYNNKSPLYNAPIKIGGQDTISLTSAIPFARPLVEQSKVMANQFVNRPLSFNGLVAKPGEIGTDIAENQQEQFMQAGRPLKEYQKYALYQDYYQPVEKIDGELVYGNLVHEPDIDKVPANAKPIMFDYGSLNPNSIIGDYMEGGITDFIGKLNPALGIAISTASGNKFGNMPLTAPDRKWGQPLSEEEKAKFLLSQIARTYTPAGMLEKYLPYKSYDSQMLVPNPKERPRTPFYYASKLFGGSESVAPKAKKKKD